MEDQQMLVKKTIPVDSEKYEKIKAIAEKRGDTLKALFDEIFDAWLTANEKEYDFEYQFNVDEEMSSRIIKALESTNNHKGNAAKKLGVSRYTLLNLMKKLHL